MRAHPSNLTLGGRAAVPALALLALASVWCSQAPDARTPAGSATATSLVVAAPTAPAASASTSPPGGRAAPSVVVRAERASGRGPDPARTLRRIVSARHGDVELADGYTHVALSVREVVEGRLPDPDYAKRPIGVNTLRVVLLDEAAAAAPDGLEGFEGTWRLTREVGDVLVAQSIEDTPFERSRAAERSASIATWRRQLRGPSPEVRLEALDALEHRLVYSLVPDILPLLEDDRVVPPPASAGRQHGIPSPRSVRDEAATRLRALFRPLGAELAPSTNDAAAWTGAWRAVLTEPPPLERPYPGGTTHELLRVSANQTWSQLVGAGEGRFALGVARLQAPIDGHVSGVALTDVRGGRRSWAFGVAGAGDEPDGVDVAVGPRGVGVLFADTDDSWRFAMLPTGAATAPAPRAVLAHASHAALAGSSRGFALLHADEDTRALRGQRLDPDGRAEGPVRAVRIPAAPATDVHRGLHPLALAALPGGGWLGAVETEEAIVLITFDDAMVPLRSSASIAGSEFAQPALAATDDRIVVAWTRDGGASRRSGVALAFHDAQGQHLATDDGLGDDVSARSRPVALADGGFALAWIEAYEEVHLARWDHDGRRLAHHLLHRGDVILANVALTTEGDAVAVAYQDAARYPFSLRARRVPLADLR